MRVSFFYIFWVSLLLTVCSVAGQTRKGKTLTEADYHLWSTLHAERISDYGKWVSYSLQYESGLDTLFVKSTTGCKTFAFAKGVNGTFVGETAFGCIMPEQIFRLTNLKTGRTNEVEKVQEFNVTIDGNYLVLYGLDRSLIVLDVRGFVITRIENVISYTMNPKGDVMGYCIWDGVSGSSRLLTFGKKLDKRIIATSQGNCFENLTWQTNGKSIVFVSRGYAVEAFSSDKVLLYRLAEQQLFEYDTKTAIDWPKDRILDASYVGNLEISDDGKRVFIRIKPTEGISKSAVVSDVQVWNATDKDLYSYKQLVGTESQLAGWMPDSKKIFNVGNSALLSSNGRYALLYNDIKPTWKQIADRDYYLRDLESNEQISFLQGLSGAVGQIMFSPNGKYILYFRDKHWWVYSIDEKKHTNITKNISVPFYDADFDQPEDPTGHGCAGWYMDDKSFLLYDQFDIWRFSSDGSVAKRLTHGREQRQIYRAFGQSNMIGVDLLLQVKAEDNIESGYSILDSQDVVKPLIYNNKLNSGFHKAKYSNAYVLIKEDFNEPPSLLYVNGTEVKTLFQSNKQHYQFAWGHSELISYTNSKGVALKGVLCYPSDYNPIQKYPMIVYIYQRQTTQLHTYSNPTLLNGASINPTLFTSQGYFVLYPDIAYEIGNPGISATDCVLSATNAALAKASIDKGKLALMGHSFGGYQTDFIITQTNLFAAAIAGSAITDLQSSYLSENQNEKNCNSWRYEYQQFRMGRPIFDDYEGYYKNSPVSGVSNITTPLFSYTGIADTQVNAYQTMEFYLALRRLQKKHVMVLYPNENHAILGKEHQVDLSHKFTEWFDYYLKDQVKPSWFELQ